MSAPARAARAAPPAAAAAAAGGGAAPPAAGAPPAGFRVADVAALLPASSLAGASELWLAQFPAGFDLRRLTGVKFKLRAAPNAADELASVKLPSRARAAAAGAAADDAAAAPSARLRFVAEDASLAAQLFVVPAPCDASQGAARARVLRACGNIGAFGARRVTLCVCACVC
jgi:hypothetical protein